MSRLAAYLPLACLLAMGLTATAPSLAATAAPEKFQSLLARMHQAYSHSHWKEYRAESAELVTFLNGSTDGLLELARANAGSGDTRAAIQDLQAAARMGVSQPQVRTLADFAGMRRRPDFRRVLGEMAANAQPISHWSQAFVIPDPGLLPEDCLRSGPRRISADERARSENQLGGDGTVRHGAALTAAIIMRTRL